MKEWLHRSGVAWLFGVIVPIVMVVVDPAVFQSKTPGLGPPALGQLKVFGYVGIALGVGVMIAALAIPKRNAFVAGMLAGASLFSIAIGVAILPLSLLGLLFFGLGLLGLTPFVSALVFASRSRRVYEAAPAVSRRALAAVGVVTFLAVPIGVQLAVSSTYRAAVTTLHSTQSDAAERAVFLLTWCKLLVNSDDLVMLWVRDHDPTLRRNLAIVYERVFGGDIAQRASALVD
jgi:hypothetical protein